MPAEPSVQTHLRIGVDVGGTFTDLVASDGRDVLVVKVPSTPPGFERGVVEAVETARGRIGESAITWIVHGSTVATNALLQRAGEPVAFITTDGFSDTLLIGRQNRPALYALDVKRPLPITEHCFGIRERIDAQGNVVTPLDVVHLTKVIDQIRQRGIMHVAVSLLFSFVNGEHERQVGDACRKAGLTVTLSSDLLPEFREYERASTTAINASLRPLVEGYLQRLQAGLPGADLRIMQSSGGTLSPQDAAAHAAKLVLSGPAGGILGAAFVARSAGFDDLITYDMGGTSTDVATILAGSPQWTTSSAVDGLPISLPMLDIHTVGAGGGSVAYVDEGGALRVGPRSAGAIPGPACYDRGGAEPTVTDANLLLGRILPDQFLGGAMKVRPDLAESAIVPLARSIGKSVRDTALGILKVVEANMEHAIRAVTSRRGHDPRRFTLVAFGGAGGLHACAIAASLGIERVLVPPYAGVLSALGMVVAPPVAESSKTVVQLGEELDDARLAAEYGQISGRTMETIGYEQTAAVEAWADVRFKGQSHELKVRVMRPDREQIEEAFRAAYTTAYGQLPEGKAVEIVTLRVRRLGRAATLQLPPLQPGGTVGTTQVIDNQGQTVQAALLTRAALLQHGPIHGSALLIDPEATAFIPERWTASAYPDGSVVLLNEFERELSP